MGFKKYVSEYRLENVPNKKGKLVTKAVYKGDYFVYRCGGEELKRARTSVVACCAVAVLSFIMALVFYRNTGFTSQYYTLIPLLACFLPLLYFVIAAYNVIVTGEGKKVDHEHKDGIHDRIAKCSVGIIILDGLNIFGILLAAILKATHLENRPFTFFDGGFMIASVALLAAAALAIGPRKKLEMVKTAG